MDTASTSYTEKQVLFENRGQKLYGFLHLPNGAGPHPAVALLHGFTGTHIEPHFIFPKTARALATAGIGVVRFDFRGSGDSEGEFQDVTLEGEIDDAHAGLDFLTTQPEVDPARIGLVGLSLGGLVASCTTATRRDVRALVLWSAVAHLGELFNRSTTDQDLVQLSAHGYTDLGGLALGAELIQQAMTTDPVAALSSYDGPTLILHGTADDVVPVEHGHRYKAALGDRAELQLLDGADHVYSSLAWESTVIQRTITFLLRHLSGA